MINNIELYRWKENVEFYIKKYLKSPQFSKRLAILSNLLRYVVESLNTKMGSYGRKTLMFTIKELRKSSSDLFPDYKAKFNDDIDTAQFEKELEEDLQSLNEWLDEVEQYDPEIREALIDEFKREEQNIDVNKLMSEVEEELKKERKQLWMALAKVINNYRKEPEHNYHNRINQLADILAATYSFRLDDKERIMLLHFVSSELKKISENIGDDL